MARKKAVGDKVSRSFVKSLTFRTIVIISDAVITFLISHRYDLTVGFVIFTNIASAILYFTHERVWDRIKWGRKRI